MSRWPWDEPRGSVSQPEGSVSEPEVTAGAEGEVRSL